MTGPSTARPRPARPRPARPRAARTSPDQRRAQVAEAARAIALEAGLDAVTLRAVAARMSVAPALVAHYAPRMDDLVADTFGGLVAAERHDVATLLDTAAEPARRLGILLETLLDGTRDDITLVWVQAWAMGARSEALASRVRDEMDAWQIAIAHEVRRGMDAGAFDPGDEAAIAWHLLAMIDGLNAHSLVRWDAHPDRRALTARAVAGLLGVSPDDLAPRTPDGFAG